MGGRAARDLVLGPHRVLKGAKSYTAGCLQDSRGIVYQNPDVTSTSTTALYSDYNIAAKLVRYGTNLQRGPGSVNQPPACAQIFTYCILGIKIKKLPKTIIFSHSNTPTRTKFDTDFKTDLKKFHNILKGCDFCG